MSDRVGDRDKSWYAYCPDRYDITLRFSGGDEYVMPKYLKEIICYSAQVAKLSLKDYIMTGPKELRDTVEIGNEWHLDQLKEVNIVDKKEETENSIQRMVDKAFEKSIKRSSRSGSARSRKRRQ